jgi:para-aminobenzoate synthetase
MVTLHYSKDNATVDQITFGLPSYTTFWDLLSTFQLSLGRACGSEEDEEDHTVFRGGFVGWFGYEMKKESLPGYVGLDVADRGKDVDACWAFCDKVLQRDAQGRWALRGVVREDVTRDASKEDMLWTWLQLNRIPIGLTSAEWDEWHAWIVASLNGSKEEDDNNTNRPVAPMPLFTPDIPPQAYIDGIQRCRKSIHDGDSYELTLTTTFRAEQPDQTATPPLSDDGKANTFNLYRRLRQRNPAPYSAYFNLPSLGMSVLSSSPERFLRINRDRKVEMKPIKGTRARVRCTCEGGKRDRIGAEACRGPGGSGCEEWCKARDAEAGRELQDDKKERAENLMVSSS